MITNSTLTVYHKSLDPTTHFEKWTRYNYDKVWFFDNKNASTNKGYDDANNVQIRIPFDLNFNLNIDNFAIGDILIRGTFDFDIQTQQDLSNYNVYNIIGISNNSFGHNPHIHLRGQ